MSTLWKDKKRTFFGLPLSLTSYELDEERLYIRTGFFTKVEDEVRLYRIMDVTMVRTLRQRILGLGTIHCCSTDASQQEFNIMSISNPREVKDLLSELVEDARERHNIYQHENMTAHPQNDSDASAFHNR